MKIWIGSYKFPPPNPREYLWFDSFLKARSFILQDNVEEITQVFIAERRIGWDPVKILDALAVTGLDKICEVTYAVR